MKTTVAFILIASVRNICLANLEFGTFGGCLNRSAIGTEDEDKAFHCHFDSTFCLDGEEWLNSAAAASEGFGPCTCDDDYNNNIFSHGCYDMQNTHAVECSANANQCPDGWYDLGSRYNSDHSVDEECGHGDPAYTDTSGGKTSSCGKRCTCNFQYQSRDTTITIGSTQYGMCYDSTAESYYCALKEDHCTSSEIYYTPHSGAMSGTDCNCDDVHLGGCMDGSSFSHCAVAIDNCEAGQTHLAPRALRETVPHVDCRLCRNSWDENSQVATPEAVPVASPVQAPVKALSTNDDGGTDDNEKSNDDDDNSSVGSIRSSLISVAFFSCFSLFLC